MIAGARAPGRHSYWVVELTTALSGAGNGIALVALPWLVLERTGSATAAGTLAAIVAVPSVLAALASGTIIDTVGRRRVAVVSDLLSLVGAALIPIADLLVGLDFALLVTLALIGAVFDPAGIGAREAMLPDAARASGVPLERANGIHEAVWGVAFVVGPGIGGLMIAAVGAAATFWITAGLFVCSAIIMALVGIPGGGRPRPEDRPESFWAGTREGLELIWHDRALRGLGLLMLALVALWLPIEGVLLPVYFQEQDMPGALGLVLLALSAGGIAGALLYGAFGAGRRRRPIMIAALVLSALGTVAMAILPPLGLMIAAAVAVGLFFGPVGPIMNIAMQTRAPPAFRGRVVGVMTATSFAAAPVGLLLAGPLVDAFGVQATFVALAVVFLAVGLVSAALPFLRELDGASGGDAQLE